MHTILHTVQPRLVIQTWNKTPPPSLKKKKLFYFAIYYFIFIIIIIIPPTMSAPRSWIRSSPIACFRCGAVTIFSDPSPWSLYSSAAASWYNNWSSPSPLFYAILSIVFLNPILYLAPFSISWYIYHLENALWNHNSSVDWIPKPIVRSSGVVGLPPLLHSYSNPFVLQATHIVGTIVIWDFGSTLNPDGKLNQWFAAYFCRVVWLSFRLRTWSLFDLTITYWRHSFVFLPNHPNRLCKVSFL